MIYSNEDILRAMREAFLVGWQAAANHLKNDTEKGLVSQALADDFIQDTRKRLSVSHSTRQLGQASSSINQEDTPPQEVKPEDDGLKFVNGGYR